MQYIQQIEMGTDLARLRHAETSQVHLCIFALDRGQSDLIVVTRSDLADLARHPSVTGTIF
jgi:hypothetical protein